MAADMILQHPILTQFILPFLLVFFIVFALLKKSSLLGEGDQLNALVAFVIGLIFAGATTGMKDIVNNMILFLTIAIIVSFVGLLLWTFISGKQELLGEASNGVKWTLAIVIILAVIVGLFWSAGIGSETLSALFDQPWSETFWTNFAFVVVLAIAIVVVLKSASGGGSGDSG